jgi:hypothetical protein
LVRFSPAAVPVEPRNLQAAGRAASIGEANAITELSLGKPAGRHRNAGVGLRRGVLGLRGRREPNARGRKDAPKIVAPGTEFQHGRTRFDGSGSKLGAGEIHRDFACLARFLFCAAQVSDHAGPRLGGVVGAVDAHAVHALKDEIADEIVVGGCFGRHRNHDADVASRGNRTEQGFGVFFKQRGALADFGSAVRHGGARFGRTCETVKRVCHGVQRADDVRLGAAERGKSERSQLRLQLADIVAPKRQVMNQIGRAGAVFRADCG